MVVVKMPTQYKKNMARLSAKIFNNAPPLSVSKKTLSIMKKELNMKPYEMDRKFLRYYPPFKEMTLLTRYLRLLGLYRDEHLDFKEEIIRSQAIRGKVKETPKRGGKKK